MTGDRHASAGGTAEDLQQAASTLTRLMALPEQIAPEVVARIFADQDEYTAFSALHTAEEVRAHLQASACATPAQPALPPERLAAAVGAFWTWARAGFGIADPATLSRRMAACARCPQQVGMPQCMIYRAAGAVVREGKICALCGCFLEKKARMATSTCPAADDDRPGFSRWGDALTKPMQSLMS